MCTSVRFFRPRNAESMVQKQRIVTESRSPAKAGPWPARRRGRRAVKHPLQQAEFVAGVANDEQLPPPTSPEIAFAGRSNAGKSSAINALANRTRLAFTSKTPGRTQQINFFRLRGGAFVADLPGYGYAAVPQPLKRHWQSFLARYLATRQSLVGLVLVVDARHGIDELDVALLVRLSHRAAGRCFSLRPRWTNSRRPAQRDAKRASNGMSPRPFRCTRRR